MDARPVTIFTHLDREWEELLETSRLDRALVRWRAVEDHLSGFTAATELLAVLEDYHADPQRQSQLLLALLCLAPRDELAARLVLQRFVPPLKSIAGWNQPLRQIDWAAMVVAAAFEVIVTYPVERRPHRVAANIVWDVRKRMYAALTEHRRWQGELSSNEPDDAPAPMDVTDRVDAADLLRWAALRSHLPPDAAELIVLTRIVGFDLEEIACDRGVPSSRLRQRRWRSEQRMREALATC